METKEQNQVLNAAELVVYGLYTISIVGIISGIVGSISESGSADSYSVNPENWFFLGLGGMVAALMLHVFVGIAKSLLAIAANQEKLLQLEMNKVRALRAALKKKEAPEVEDFLT